MKYNEEQRRAIRHKDGPAFVLAGPGSGKTAVLTRRVLYLVEEGINPADILVITFTRAAAEEMKRRYLKLSGREETQVTFGTFHAVFFHILRKEEGYGLRDLLSAGEKRRILSFILREKGWGGQEDSEKLEELETAISKWKNLGMTRESLPALPHLEEIAGEMTERMRRQRRLDFDDMQLLTAQLFAKDKRVLSKWQSRYRYILVDEFQDINPIQYELVRKLALPENNLFVVGDDDQSIYSFRGSDPGIMLSFPQQYPSAEKFMLGINYRCKKEIVEAAARLIACNEKRFAKDLKSGLDGEGRIQRLEFPSQEAEAEGIAGEIARRLQRGQEPEEITVLFRTRMNVSYLLVRLEEKNIPFYIEGKEEDIYSHWIAKDFFSYLALAEGGRRRSDLLRILNHPKRGLGREYLEKEEVDLLEWQSMLPAEEKRAASRLIRDLDRMKKMSCFARLSYISHGMAYQAYLKDYAAEKGIEEEKLLQTLEILLGEAKKYQSLDSWKEAVRLQKKRQEREEKNPHGKISLRSLHGAKGLEFESVFIIGMQEGNIPYKRAVEEGLKEEERRLLYVGMTRAKKELYLSFAASVRSRKQAASSFFTEFENAE